LIILELVLRRLLGVFWGLLGAQVGPSWLPKASWTRSGLQKAILQKYHVFPSKTTHSGLPEPPKTGQDRPKTGPRSSREALENKLFPCYFLESIFWRSKSEQNLIKNCRQQKSPQDDSKRVEEPPWDPPRPPQDPPRAPPDPPRSTPGAPKLAKY
jgi:hypothetical protein